MREGSSVRVSCGPGVGGARVRAAKVSTCQSRAEPHKQPNLRATPEMGKWDPGVVSSRPPFSFSKQKKQKQNKNRNLRGWSDIRPAPVPSLASQRVH